MDCSVAPPSIAALPRIVAFALLLPTTLPSSGCRTSLVTPSYALLCVAPAHCFPCFRLPSSSSRKTVVVVGCQHRLL
ncbi:hypothetical protein GW17_00050426 [Ensete ventricosum]|nr:hypothetical protein GW17_00050426 [Ensete ventricosum]